MFERKSMSKLSVWWVACLAGMLLLLGMLFGGTHVAYADDAQAVQAQALAPADIGGQATGVLYVGNTDVSAGGDFTVDGVVCNYDTSTYTLTLSGNGTITSTYNSRSVYSSLDSDLNIIVVGSVTLTNSASYGIYKSGSGHSLDISGAGALTINTSGTGIYLGGSDYSNSDLRTSVASLSVTTTGMYAIWASRGAVYINSGSVSLSADSYGVKGYKGVSIAGDTDNVSVVTKKTYDAISSNEANGVAIGDGLAITTPEGGKINDDGNKICAADGANAPNVVIERTAYALWVGETQVTKANAANITGSGITSGTVSFNPDTKTLTLTDATITGVYAYDSSHSDNTANIYSALSNLRIEGSATLSNAYIAIYAIDTNLALSGTGNGISATGSSMGVHSNCSSSTSSGGNLVVNGKVTSNGQGLCGMNAYHDVVIENGADVKTYGGTSVATYTYASCGIDAYKGTITVNGGTVYSEGNEDGMLAHLGVIVKGGTVTAKSTASGSHASRGIRIDGTGAAVSDGRFVVTGGTVTTTGGDANSTNSSGVELLGKADISGGSVKASGCFGIRATSGASISGDATRVEATAVGASSATKAAFTTYRWGQGPITIGEGLVITTPVGGVVAKGSQLGADVYSVYEADGTTVAQSVVIQPGNMKYYDEYDANTTTLTFKGAALDAIPEGAWDATATGTNQPWSTANGTVTTVVFDPTFAGARPTSTANWFSLCSKLTMVTGIENLNTSKVTQMQGMFTDCSHLMELDLSHFDTSNVTNMSSMFAGCSWLGLLGLSNLDLSSFDTSKVTGMVHMFHGCSNLRSLDLSGFNTSKVTSFQGMFYSCFQLASLDISGFDTSSATDMYDMFAGSTELASVKLGSTFSFKGKGDIAESLWAKLPTPSSASPYTGKWWKEVGGTEYTPVEMQSLTGDAVAGTWTWAQEVKTVTFDSNGGSAVASAKVVTGSAVAKPADPTRSGYTFKEWQLNGAAYDFSKAVTSDITLKAAWDAAPAPVAKRTVSFAANGGSGSMASVQVDSGSTYTLPACTFTAPSGKEFDKWDKGAPGAKITVTADTTLTAQWKDAAKPEPKPDPEPGPEPGPDPEPTPTPVAKIEMRRLYNPYSYEHFYTADADEQANLVGLGWVDEGLGWTAPETSDIPVYRLYNPYNGGDHHYTKSADERDALVAAGWQDEGTGWYSAGDDGTPVYREYNPFEVVRNHNYTTDKGEHDGLVAIGWHDEDIAWYGV